MLSAAFRSRKIVNFVTFGLFARSSRKIVNFLINPGHKRAGEREIEGARLIFAWLIAQFLRRPYHLGAWQRLQERGGTQLFTSPHRIGCEKNRHRNMGIGERAGLEPWQTESRPLFHTVSGYFPNVTRTVRNNLRSGPVLPVLIHSL